MKTPIQSKVITLLALSVFAVLVAPADGHEGVEIGPNGGRILEFSKDESRHGELTLKDGKFHLALLDQDMKPMVVDKQSLTATSGTRQSPVRLEVEKSESGFVFPEIEPGQWLILQYKEKPLSRAITARMEYDTSVCEECDSPEWLCSCVHDDA